MIYTVTLNPSLDFLSQVDDLKKGQINYSVFDAMAAGGRAITISRLLRTLNVPTLATGFLGGKTGAFIEEELDKQDIPHDFVHVKHNTRINLSIFTGTTETRILGEGKEISVDEINELMYYLSRIREGDFLILAGSLPPQMSPNIYDRMIEIATVNGSKFLPIIYPELLRKTLDNRPLLITPDAEDLGIMFEEKITTREEAIPFGLQCIEEGAQNVIVPFKREGSLLFTADKKVYEAEGPTGPMISSTYTNVSLAAGFIGNYMKTGDPLESFKMAQAVSNATYGVIQLPTFEEITQAFEELNILPLV